MVLDHVRDKLSGWTVAEWLKAVPNELSRDAVGLWQIIPLGRHDFGLTGSDLIEFTRRALLALLHRGARPVRGASNPERWIPVSEYGDDPEQIADAVIAEWLSSGAGDPDMTGLWFATPEVMRD
jgi:hypothetical protein